MSSEGELWHIVEAKRDDGTPTMFRIRELDPKKQLTKIFVVELPYPKTELSRLPNASAYRRLAEFDDQWLRPACTALGWELVGSKTEDGSFFLYMYGASDPNALVEKLSPFDAALGFYDDDDPEWAEYGTLRELLDQAKAIPPLEEALGAAPSVMEPDVEVAAPPPTREAKARPAPPARKAKAANATPKAKKAKAATAKAKAATAKAKAKAKKTKAATPKAKAKPKPKKTKPTKAARPKTKTKPARKKR